MSAIKNHIVSLLLLCCFTISSAQQDSAQAFKRFAIKYSPTSFVLSQLPYCSDLQFNFEYRINEHDALIIGAQGSIPKFTYFVFGRIFKYYEFYVIGGARGSFAYRRYLFPSKRKEPGFYIGAEVAIAGYVTPRGTYPSYINRPDYAWAKYPHRLKGIMTNYNFTIGYETVANNVVVDVGISIGARYHYFWRQYEYGNLELNRDAGSLYSYFKKSPLGGSINCSIGGLF